MRALAIAAVAALVAGPAFAKGLDQQDRVREAILGAHGVSAVTSFTRPTVYKGDVQSRISGSIEPPVNFTSEANAPRSWSASYQEALTLQDRVASSIQGRGGFPSPTPAIAESSRTPEQGGIATETQH